MKRTWVGAGVLAIFAGAVVFGAMNELRVKCEVCMAYQGRHTCEVAHAGDEDHAILQATTAACSKISAGVTDGIRCGNTPPRSTTCGD